MSIRCTYCGRFNLKKEDKDRCDECIKEMKTVAAAIIKRFGGALKRLADK